MIINKYKIKQIDKWIKKKHHIALITFTRHWTQLLIIFIKIQGGRFVIMSHFTDE